ncbi:MAG: phosphoribosyltransferase [Rhodospirillaceae bacterium]|nr:phosphoribosyltransferase [Rhodospirillaceae bacterium]
MSRPFIDRQDAGRRLAAELVRFKDEHPVVLAIPRGGVLVGFEVAQALNAPLDLVLVRKIGAPFQPELAVAAVVDGEHAQTVLNEDIISALELPADFIREETARQLAEIERRRQAYLGSRPRPPIAGATAIIVDDGIATGATVRAALLGVRRSGPRRLVLAVPVAPPSTIERLRGDADETVCLEMPESFFAISQFYQDFHQLSDAEVTALLRRAAPPDGAADTATGDGPAARQGAT